MCKCDNEDVPDITNNKPAVPTTQTEPSATTLPDTTPPITEETTTIEMTTTEDIQVPTQIPYAF